MSRSQWTMAGAVLLIVLLLGPLALCGQSDGKEADMSQFSLQSSAFENGAKIPLAYGCGEARNYKKPSPPLVWSGVPEGTKSFILLMDDPHPAAKNWVHWFVIDLPSDARALLEGISGATLPGDAHESKNSWNESGYGGPCPPKGSHTYRFQLFAMRQASTSIETQGRRGDALTNAIAKLEPLGVATLEGVFP